MTSFASAAPAASGTLTGSRIQFMLQGVLVGFAQNLSYSHQIGYSPINVLGSIEVEQHIPVAYTASITFNNFRVLNRNLRTLGLWGKPGKNAQEHLINISQIPELTAVCTDIITNTVVLVAEGVRVESSSVQAAANQVIVEDLSCVVRRLLLEGDL